MWTALHRRTNEGLRSKLLALVILPLLLTMVATLGYAFYWVNAYTRDILRGNVRDNLSLARHALREIQQDYQVRLKQQADSESFRRALAANDSAGVQRALRRLKQEQGFAFAHVTGLAANWLHEPSSGPHGSSKPSPLTDRAARGMAGGALELFRFDDLMREDSMLPERARIAVRTPATAESAGDMENRALMLRVVQPLVDHQGKVMAVLDSGVLLNYDATVMETIRARVFRAGNPAADSEAVATLLLERTRVGAIGAGAVGEQVTAELRDEVIGRGDTWVGRDSIGGRWFISAYGPLFDVHGSRIGMLHVGFPESAFNDSHYRAAALLLVIFLGATAAAAVIALRGARSVCRPIEEMTAVVRATQAGADRRIGPVPTHDEIGELARQFDLMLDLLARRNQELKDAAETLEAKVADRTQELAKKNVDLEATIQLLQQTRAQLVMAEKLSALGVLAAGIAHEINNPSAVILGNLELLTAELGDAARPVEHEINLIAQQVDRIQHIVTSLLQFARPGASVGAIAEVDVNRAIEEVLPLVAHVLKNKSIALRKRLGASGVIRINVYELEQVLINLLLNAANAVESGGRVEVETTDADRDRVVIRVGDDGAGIPPALLSRLFDPFFTTDARRGTGLGLSVSYGLIRRYGGDITVESTVGKGSVFQVWLRRAPVVAEARATGDESGLRGQVQMKKPEAEHERRGGVG